MRLALALAVMAFINTCHEEQKEPGPVICFFEKPCMNDRVAEIAAEPDGETKATVTLITTKTGFYYLISGRCCDKPDQLLDAQCNVVCTYGAATLCLAIEDEISRRVVWEDTHQ